MRVRTCGKVDGLVSQGVCTKSHPSGVGAASLLRNKIGDDHRWLGRSCDQPPREGASAVRQFKAKLKMAAGLPLQFSTEQRCKVLQSTGKYHFIKVPFLARLGQDIQLSPCLDYLRPVIDGRPKLQQQ